jgi:hypothetical protein
MSFTGDGKPLGKRKRAATWEKPPNKRGDMKQRVWDKGLASNYLITKI